MADFTTTYKEIEPETVFSSRRRDLPLVDGPASFLALAVKLGVPVFARRQLRGDAYSAGAGLSFSVARAMTGMTLRKDVDWVNKIPRGWFDRVAVPSDDDEVVKIKGYITKRMVLSRRWRDQNEDGRDAKTFAAITTEMRILAHEAIRQSRNIVALIGISWSTPETFGRFLPELLLESAMHSSLNQYIRVSHHRLGFLDKALMLLDIVSGLGFLHENGIVHCDVKPGNILICECSERQSLESLDMKPFIVKLCDFGCSIILSDYPENHQFLLKVGTPGWMAPEMEQGLELDSGTLLKTDMYSLGHVAAAIAVGTRLPVDILPSSPADEEISASNHDGPIRNVEFISALLIGTGKDKDLSETQLALFSEIISCTLQSKPSDRADAADIYRLCRRHLLKDIRKFHSEKPLNGDLSGVDHLKSVLPICPGKPLAKAEAIDETCIKRVPDFAFEIDIRSSQLPRQCRKEVYEDLERRVAGNLRDAGDCALQLAALLLNGYLEDDGKMKEKVKASLVQAIASSNEVAMSGAMNVLQAMGEELPGDSRLRIMQRFQDPNFREQGIAEVKSLFFPLAFDTSTMPEPPTGAACFPYVHRQDINEKLVGVRSWARECKQDFAAYLASREYRRTLYTVVLRIMEQQSAISYLPRQCPPFHSVVDRYIHDPDLTLGLLNPHEQEVFIREILDRDMLDEPTEVGLTLLQHTVCRGDMLAARTLLEEGPGADANAWGTTPHWTPLWLACFLGHHEMATLLIRHGADMTCQDSVQGITVLHLLCQFSSQEEVEGIGYQALAVGMDVNTGFDVNKEEQNRVTPLLASMLVFDFSDGAAARFLLDNGASPLYFTASYSEAYNLPVSPLSLCILNLDTALLESILSADFPSLPGRNKARSVRLAQAVGVQLMRTKTCFRAMFETGENYKNLKSILRVVIGWMESRIFYWNPELSPLGFAYDIDRADMIKLLLKINPDASLDLEDAGAKLNMLEQCVARHNFRCVKALVRHGADVLGSTMMNENMLSSVLGERRIRDRMPHLMPHLLKGESRLSRMAKDMPSILGFVIDHLESLPAEKRGGQSVRSILTSWQVDTAGIFDTLIIEGNSEELVIAEALRAKYRLGHDRVQPFPPNTTTLIGALIVWSNAYGYERLDQVRYLLSLEPKPQFHLPSGINLLQLALIISEGTDAVQQMELIRLLLNAYPDMENLTRGWRHHLPPLLQAATGTNLEVVRLLEDHVRTMHPGKTFPYNHLHHRAESEDGSPAMMTMLDACSLSIRDRGLVDHKYGYGMLQQSDRKSEEKIRLGLVDQLGRHNSRKAIFKYLREKGAQLWYELEGYFIGGRIAWMTSMPTRDLYAFLQRTTMKHSLGPWVHRVADNKTTWADVKSRISSTGEMIGDNIPDFMDDLSQLALFSGTSGLATQFQFLRIFELMWSENCLRLNACDLAFPTADVSRQVNRYLSTRAEQKKAWRSIYGENPPYATTDCLEPWVTKQDGAEAIDYPRYTRPGRVWTPDEVGELAETVFGEWSEEFGEREEAIPAELRAVVMSYF